MGRATRIELATSRATIWRSNQLSYARHLFLVRLKRFELLTHGLEGRCSILLSYRRIFDTFAPARFSLERVMGIGPTRPAWKAGLLPLNYTRIRVSVSHKQRSYIITLFEKIVKQKYAVFTKNLKKFFLPLFLQKIVFNPRQTFYLFFINCYID